TPRASGGFRPTSHSPTRTISSQLATPAALTEITSSSGAGGPGSATSSKRTSPRNASIPAACIRRTATGGILEGYLPDAESAPAGRRLSTPTAAKLGQLWGNKIHRNEPTTVISDGLVAPMLPQSNRPNSL